MFGVRNFRTPVGRICQVQSRWARSGPISAELCRIRSFWRNIGSRRFGRRARSNPAQLRPTSSKFGQNFGRIRPNPARFWPSPPNCAEIGPAFADIVPPSVDSNPNAPEFGQILDRGSQTPVEIGQSWTEAARCGRSRNSLAEIGQAWSAPSRRRTWPTSEWSSLQK